MASLMKLHQTESSYANWGGGVSAKDAKVNGINLPDAAAVAADGGGTRDANSFDG
jgi:hypothetical protein